jgi:hypothetical protein
VTLFNLIYHLSSLIPYGKCDVCFSTAMIQRQVTCMVVAADVPIKLLVDRERQVFSVTSVAVIVLCW